MVTPEEEPRFIISIAAAMAGVHEQTLRHYERLGLIRPARTKAVAGIRLFSRSEIDRVIQIQRLVEDLGVNLAGVDVILRLTERMEQQMADMRRAMDEQRQEHEAEVRRLRRIMEERMCIPPEDVG